MPSWRGTGRLERAASQPCLACVHVVQLHPDGQWYRNCISAVRFGAGLENARRQLVQPFSSTMYNIPSGPWVLVITSYKQLMGQTMARSEQSDLGCEILWHFYTNKSFTVDRLIREVLAETQNQCQCPNPTSSMSNGTFEAWFLETLPPVGSSDASGRYYSWHF